MVNKKNQSFDGAFLHKFALVFVILFSVWHVLSSHAFLDEVGTREKVISLYTNDMVRVVNLDNQIASLQSSLEYQVWPQQKAKAHHLLREALQAKINIRPYSSYDWLMLNSLNHNDSSFANNREWVMNNAIVLNAWNPDVKYLLSYYCISHIRELNGAGKGRCRDIVGKLPVDTRAEWLAKRVNVELSLLINAYDKFRDPNVLTDE